MIMKHQKITNLLQNKPNWPSKFRTKNWIEVNHESRGTYNVNSQIKFKTSMLILGIWTSSDSYILASTTITVLNTASVGAEANDRKNIITKNWPLFTNSIREINNTQIDNRKHIDIVMPIYNLIEYSDNFSWQHKTFWIKITKFFKQHVSIILWSFSI